MANPSRMDQRVTLQRYAQTYAADGSKATTTSILLTCWARVVVESGTEGQDVSQAAGFVNLTFEVRYCPDLATLNPADVIIWRDSTYVIQSVIPTPAGRPDILKISAQARADQSLTTPSA